MAPDSGESTRENFTHSGSKASRKGTLSHFINKEMKILVNFMSVDLCRNSSMLRRTECVLRTLKTQNFHLWFHNRWQNKVKQIHPYWALQDYSVTAKVVVKLCHLKKGTHWLDRVLAVQSHLGRQNSAMLRITANHRITGWLLFSNDQKFDN